MASSLSQIGHAGRIKKISSLFSFELSGAGHASDRRHGPGTTRISADPDTANSNKLPGDK